MKKDPYAKKIDNRPMSEIMAELRSKGNTRSMKPAAAPAKPKPGTFTENLATMGKVMANNAGQMAKQKKVIIDKKKR